VADFFSLFLAAGWMGADIEPDLQDVGNRNAVADDRGSEHRLPEGGYAHINVSPVFCAFGRKPHAFEDVPVEAFEIELLDALHEAEPQRLGRGKQPEAGPWRQFAL
jgi:hypothetical protein